MSSYKLGIKLWSNNRSLAARAQKIYQQRLINYIELYVVPGTYLEYIETWRSLDMPYIIHAPNESILDTSDINSKQNNQYIFSEVQQFADELSSDTIVVHPGSGDINQNIEQLKSFSDKRILIENMPFYSLYSDSKLNGSRYENVKELLLQTEYGFCLDIGHAIIAANNLEVDYSLLINRLLELKPKLYHLNDGQIDGIRDSHMHFGQGNFPLQQIMQWIPLGAKITLETPKIIEGGDLSDFVQDIKYLQNLFSKEISLRKVEQKDCNDLLRWRNHSEVRKWCINTQKIKLADHKKWLKKAMLDKNKIIYIAENNKGQKIGQVRLEKNNKESFNININLNPRYFNQGYGNRIIEKATKLFLEDNPEVKEINATILDNNIASQKAFQKAGYYFSHKILKDKQSLNIYKF